MKKIYVHKNYYTNVSDEDYEYLNQWLWHVSGNIEKNNFYVVRTVHITNNNNKTIRIRMHHEIIQRMGLVIPQDYEPDHKDRNTLNNQRENLRVVTRSVNNYNRKIKSTNTSSITGVNYDSYSNRWAARIVINGYRRKLGTFVTFEEAVEARLKAEEKYSKFMDLPKV